MNKQLFPRIKSKFWFKNGRIAIYPFTTRIRRFYARLRGYPFTKVYLKVEYGIKKTCFEKEVYHTDGTSTKPEEMFYNSGTYKNKKEALQVLKAFLE